MSTSDEMEGLRREIEALDRKLVKLIAHRIALAQRIGSAKRAAGLPMLDPAREATVIRRAGSLAREHDLPDEDVRAIFWRVIGLCRREQQE